MTRIARRTILGTAVLSPLIAIYESPLAQTGDAFIDLLKRETGDASLLSPEVLNYREGADYFYEEYTTRRIGPRRRPSNRSISQRAIELIIHFEVSSPARYEREFQSPIWPYGQSGVTIGIGYDLGYVRPEWFREDWPVEQSLLSEADYQRLLPTVGKKGPEAGALIPSVSSIRIPWEIARRQFLRYVLQRYVAETEAGLRNTDKLSEDCLGALASLVYNRGASFQSQGARYRHMRNIFDHSVREDWHLVRQELLDMREIWAGDPNLRGLLRRRELEAQLFQQGLVRR
jgi:GH24 family phage-related lysozyme (muramidase)